MKYRKDAPVGEACEFGAGELAAAAAYIESQPAFVHQVYIDLQEPDGGWVFVYRGERSAALRLLTAIVHGRRFRIRKPYVVKHHFA